MANRTDCEKELRYYPVIDWKDRRIDWETSTRIVGMPTEFRKRHLLNTRQTCSNFSELQPLYVISIFLLLLRCYLHMFLQKLPRTPIYNIWNTQFINIVEKYVKRLVVFMILCHIYCVCKLFLCCNCNVISGLGIGTAPKFILALGPPFTSYILFARDCTVTNLYCILLSFWLEKFWWSCILITGPAAYKPRGMCITRPCLKHATCRGYGTVSNLT
jgi:hypothetical protein